MYPSDVVLQELSNKFGKDKLNPVWIYLHDDLQNKCAQERALGKKCEWIN